MVVNRIGSQPNIISSLLTLARKQRERKELQIVGADSITTFLVGSSNEWDFEGVLPAGTTVQNPLVLAITFSPRSKRSAGFDIYVKGEYVDSPQDSPEVFVVRDFVEDIESQRWKARVNYYGDEAIRLKFFVVATGRGTLSVV